MNKKMIFNYAFLFILVSFLSFSKCQNADNADFEAGARYMQNIIRTCTIKHNTDTDEIIKTYNYESNDANAKCAIMCILQSVQIMGKDGNFNTETMIQIINKIEDPVKRSEIKYELEDCVGSNAEDLCDRAFVFTKCIAKYKDELPHFNIPTF